MKSLRGILNLLAEPMKNSNEQNSTLTNNCKQKAIDINAELVAASKVEGFLISQHQKETGKAFECFNKNISF